MPNLELATKDTGMWVFVFEFNSDSFAFALVFIVFALIDSLLGFAAGLAW